jgi:hypothetical protein
MISLSIDQLQIKRLETAVRRAGKSISREISAAINSAAKKTRLDMGRKIRSELNIGKESVESVIKIVRPSTPGSLSAGVRLKETKRLPLRDFGAKQNKAGVSYKISKKGGRATVPSAFTVASIGNHAFKRVGVPVKMKKGRYAGKMRQPIIKLMGPSPWGVFVKQRMTAVQVRETEAELKKQIERRINLNVLRANKLVQS